MKEEQLIYIASVAIGKNISYENLKYSDYLYGREDQIDNVWKYVEEAEANGRKWFRENYKDFKLYPV